MNYVVHVQVDRLPTVTHQGKRKIQLGLRLSIASEAKVHAAENPETVLRVLLPWQWKAANGTEGDWNTHDATNWALWVSVAGGPLERITGHSSPLAVHPADARLIKEMTHHVSRLAVDAPTTFASSSIAQGRPPSVFGFVESLSQFPAPVPAQLKVWTCMMFDDDEKWQGQDVVFYAAPLAAADTLDFTQPTNLPEPQKDGTGTPKEDAPWTLTYSIQEVKALIEPSLRAGLLTGDVSVPDSPRCIDLSTLGIVRKGEIQFESFDWLSELPRQFPAVFDFGVTAFQELDDALRTWIGLDERRRALVLDDVVSKADLLRRFLACLRAESYFTLFRSAANESSAGAELLRLLAEEDPELWAVCVSPLLAVMRADHATLQGGGPFPVAARALELLAGSQPLRGCSRENLLAMAEVTRTAATEAAFAPIASELLLDDEDAPIHAMVAVLEKAFVKELAGTQLAATEVSWSNVNEETISPAEVIDLSPLWESPEQAQMVPIVFGIRQAQSWGANAKISFLDGDRVAVCVLDNLMLSGVDPATGVAVTAGGIDSFIRFSLSGQPNKDLKVSCTIGGGPASEVIIASGNERGALRLELSPQAAAALDMGVDALSRENLQKLRAALRADGPAAWHARLSRARSSAALTWIRANMRGLDPTDPAKDSFVVLAKRAADKLLEALFAFASARAEESAAATDPTAPRHDFTELRTILLDRSKTRCAALIDELIPPRTIDLPRPVSQVATPLLFSIDQLQDFDENVDLWTRLSGVGVLMARTKAGDDPSTWWSLNVATLHAQFAGVVGARPAFDENNSIVVRGGTHWTEQARVDPVPWVVGESNGVRTAYVRYDNQSLVGEMQGSPRLDATGNIESLRRPEGYLFPVGFALDAKEKRRFAQLPSLTFGRVYHILPYLISHGGALPIWLRHSEIDPTTRKKYAKGTQPDVFPDGSSGEMELDYAVVKDYVRSERYVRTVPVGAPRLASSSVLPGIPTDVEPLASSLAIHPSVVTIYKGRPAYFYYDARGGRGLIDMPTGQADGLRVEFASSARGKNQPTEFLLQIMRCESGRMLSQPWLECSCSINETEGLRVEADTTQARVFALLRDESNRFYEDEPVARDLGKLLPLQMGQWTLLIRITCPDTLDSVDLEPPRVVVGRWESGEFLADRTILPPESTHHSRSVHILDSISAVGQRSTMAIHLLRPSVDFETFARWINGPIAGYGEATRADTVAALNIASRRSRSSTENADRSLIDPACEGIFIEVVRLFPHEEVVLPATRLVGPAAESPPKSHVDAGVNVPIKTDVKNARTASFGKGELTLGAGGVYEIRAYAAIAVLQLKFAPAQDTTLVRTANAVTQSWRRVGDCYLGPPLTLTVEVTTDEMPVIYNTRPLRFDLRRSEQSSEDRALVRLDTGISKDESIRWRYVGEAALMSQRWSWRGRPQPIPPRGIETSSTVPDTSGWADGGRNPLPTVQEEYFDAAFMGRSIDDVGTLLERNLTPAHAYGGRPTLLARRWNQDPVAGAPPANETEFEKRTPVLFHKELDYRSGAHLWRFALRIRSRYAPMHPDNRTLVAFSHRLANSTSVRWQSVLVRQQDAGRRPQRPGLMLVLPLTEPLTLTGSVPPLLAIFNEPMHAGFHAGDGIEGLVELTRHPLTEEERRREFQVHNPKIGRALIELEKQPTDTSALILRNAVRNTVRSLLGYWRAHALGNGTAALIAAVETLEAVSKEEWLKKTPEERKQTLEPLSDLSRLADGWITSGDLPSSNPQGHIKYWPEFGPDGIRSGAAHTGELIACRLDGPIGYTFDEQVEAGRFDHAAFVASAVGTKVAPWSLIKLRFRRFEAPELALVRPLELSMAHEQRILIANPAGAAPIHPGVQQFNHRHEGAALDLPIGPGRTKLRLQCEGGAGQMQFDVSHTRSAKNDDLTIHIETDLGHTGNWSTTIRPDADVYLRVVAVVRPPPDDPIDYVPVADVSARVFVSDKTTDDGTQSLQSNQWLTVGCLPLVFEPDSAPVIKAQSLEGVASLQMRPLRASELTPAVWCQFAAHMSEFQVRIDNLAPQIKLADELAGVVKGKSIRLQSNSEVKSDVRSLSAIGSPEANSQLEEALYFVVTRYVHDALDRRQERPVAIYELPRDPADVDYCESACDERHIVWSARGFTALPSDGRARIMRVLRGKNYEPGWIDPDLPKNQRFERLFTEPAAAIIGKADMDMNPGDAGGLVLGISHPFPIVFQP